MLHHSDLMPKCKVRCPSCAVSAADSTPVLITAPSHAMQMALQQPTACRHSAEAVWLQGKRVVVFVIGGITRSEIRTAHVLTEQLGRDVVLGSTSILTPASFLANLKVSHRLVTTTHDRRVATSMTMSGGAPSYQSMEAMSSTAVSCVAISCIIT